MTARPSGILLSQFLEPPPQSKFGALRRSVNLLRSDRCQRLLHWCMRAQPIRQDRSLGRQSMSSQYLLTTSRKPASKPSLMPTELCTNRWLESPTQTSRFHRSRRLWRQQLLHGRIATSSRVRSGTHARPIKTLIQRCQRTPVNNLTAHRGLAIRMTWLVRLRAYQQLPHQMQRPHLQIRLQAPCRLPRHTSARCYSLSLLDHTKRMKHISMWTFPISSLSWRAAFKHILRHLRGQHH